MVDGRLERMDQFSQNAIKAYKEAKRQGRPYRVRCRHHTQGIVTELKCVSCGQVKAVDLFSNNERKSFNPRCRDCVAWTEADMPTSAPLPAPGEDRAPDETKFALNRRDADESDQEMEECSAGMDDMVLNDDATDVSRSVASDIDHGNDGHITYSALSIHNHRVQPRGRAGTYNPSSAPSAPSDVASTTGTARPSPCADNGNQVQGRHYPAYGPDGQVQWRAQSVLSASDATSATTTTAIRESRSGWAKPEGRRTAPDAPNYLVNKHPDEPKQAFRYDDSDSADEC